MSVVLKSANEKNTLYKNPKILIILPQGIESIKVNSINKLYADEFEVSKAELKNIDGLGTNTEILQIAFLVSLVI